MSHTVGFGPGGALEEPKKKEKKPEEKEIKKQKDLSRPDKEPYIVILPPKKTTPYTFREIDPTMERLDIEYFQPPTPGPTPGWVEGIQTKWFEYETVMAGPSKALREKATGILSEAEEAKLRGEDVKAGLLFSKYMLTKSGAGLWEGFTLPFRPMALMETIKFPVMVATDPELRKQIWKEIKTDPAGFTAEVAGGFLGGTLIAEIGSKIYERIKGPKIEEYSTSEIQRGSISEARRAKAKPGRKGIGDAISSSDIEPEISYSSSYVKRISAMEKRRGRLQPGRRGATSQRASTSWKFEPTKVTVEPGVGFLDSKLYTGGTGKWPKKGITEGFGLVETGHDVIPILVPKGVGQTRTVLRLTRETVYTQTTKYLSDSWRRGFYTVTRKSIDTAKTSITPTTSHISNIWNLSFSMAEKIIPRIAPPLGALGAIRGIEPKTELEPIERLTPKETQIHEPIEEAATILTPISYTRPKLGEPQLPGYQLRPIYEPKERDWLQPGYKPRPRSIPSPEPPKIPKIDEPPPPRRPPPTPPWQPPPIIFEPPSRPPKIRLEPKKKYRREPWDIFTVGEFREYRVKMPKELLKGLG